MMMNNPMGGQLVGNSLTNDAMRKMMDKYRNEFQWDNSHQMDAFRALTQPKPPTVDVLFMEAHNSHAKQVTDAIRKQIHRHLPRDVQGKVGDKIAACLDEVREYHWREDAKRQEHWGYELVFKIEGDTVVFHKQFTLDRIVTDTALADGSYAIPYSNILGCLVLTDTEVLTLATAL